MPTYSYRCEACGATRELVMPISEYVRNPPQPFCCDTRMQRYIDVVPGLAIHNALANDRHYENLRATDGTDISSRAKHRAYMKANNLTTADDFRETWKREERAREARLAGDDPQRAHDIAQAIHKLGG